MYSVACYFEYEPDEPQPHSVRLSFVIVGISLRCCVWLYIVGVEVALIILTNSRLVAARGHCPATNIKWVTVSWRFSEEDGFSKGWIQPLTWALWIQCEWGFSNLARSFLHSDFFRNWFCWTAQVKFVEVYLHWPTLYSGILLLCLKTRNVSPMYQH